MILYRTARWKYGMIDDAKSLRVRAGEVVRAPCFLSGRRPPGNVYTLITTYNGMSIAPIIYTACILGNKVQWYAHAGEKEILWPRIHIPCVHS